MAKLDVCSTEYPSQIFLDKKYIEKGLGEYLYGGVRGPGTWWVERSEPSGSKFDQNRVGGSDQGIRDKVGQHNTREQVGGSKLAIREQAIGGVSDWGVSVLEQAIGELGMRDRLIGE